MALEFGIGFALNSDVTNIVKQVQDAEAAGFTHATYIDSGHVAQDVSVMLTLMGLNTRHIHVGQAVVDPVTWSPTVIANFAATLRELTSNRTFVGLGLGQMGRPLLARAARLEELRQAVTFIRTYTAGDEAQLGEHKWHSVWIRGSRYRGSPVPVYVAATGPRTCHLAGEVADAVFSPGADPILQAWRKEMIEQGALAAGRDASRVKLWARTQIYIAEDNDLAYRETAPYAASNAYEFYEVVLRKSPEIINLARRLEAKYPSLLNDLKATHDAWDPYYSERLVGPQSQVTTRSVVDFFLAVGSAETVKEKLGKLEVVGVTGVSTNLFATADPGSMIKEIAGVVMPRYADPSSGPL